jgi:hypothetical protein
MKSSLLKMLRLTLFLLLVLADLSSARFLGWSFIDGQLTQSDHLFPHPSSERVIPLQSAVIGSKELCIHNNSGRITVDQCGAESSDFWWQSPDGWEGKEAFFADLDRNGEQELVLLVWRPFAPWPVDRFMPRRGRIDTFHDANGNSGHLILIRLSSEEPEEIWAGSALSDPIHSLLAIDLDGDGYQELAAIEYAYDNKNSDGSVVVWQWNGFGFSLADRENGTYRSLFALSADQSVILITQQ